MSDVIDAVADFIEDAWDYLGDVVDAVWDEIVAPIAEEIFNFLGFEDKTVVSGFVATQRLTQGTPYEPWKRLVINTLANDTEFIDEIQNYFLTGEHFRARAYYKYGKLNGLLPGVTLDYFIPNCAGAETIIESALFANEPVTIRNCVIGFLTEEEYCIAYLQGNPTGYTWIPEYQALLRASDGVTLFLLNTGFFAFDVVNNGYDIYTEQRADERVIQTAINVAITVTPTYSSTNHTTYHEVIIDTCTVPTMPTVDPYNEITSITPVTLEELVPASGQSGRQYKILYTLDSDLANPQTRYRWYYELEASPVPPYDTLYTTNPAAGEPIQYKEAFPFAGIMLDEVWTVDLLPTDQTYIDNNKIMDKYGITLQEMTDAIREGNNPDAIANLKDAFFGFGINIALSNSQSEFSYLFNFFEKFSYNQGHTKQDYLDVKDDLAFIQSYIDGYTTTNLGDGERSVSYVITGGVDYATLYTLLDQYAHDLALDFYNEYLTQLAIPLSSQEAWNNAVALYPDFDKVEFANGNLVTSSHWLLETAKTTIDDIKKQMTTKFVVESDRFNLNMSYGYVSVTDVPGVVANVGQFTKTIQATNYTLILRKQIDAGNYREIEVVDLMAFTALLNGATQVKFVAYDFVGSDAGGENVANNMFLPLVYGFFNDEGIYNKKELVHHSAMLCMYNLQVIYLRYYETAEFLGFVDGIIKIVSIVGIFVGAPNIGDAIWGLAKAYAVKTITERIIQEIALADPDSDLAVALAIVLGLSVGFGGDLFDSEALADNLLKAVDVTNQAVTTYNRVSTEVTQDFLEDQQEELDRIRDEISTGRMRDPGLLEYIQKQFTISLVTPEAFYQRHLNADVASLATDVAYLTSLDNFTDVERYIVTNYTDVSPTELPS